MVPKWYVMVLYGQMVLQGIKHKKSVKPTPAVHFLHNIYSYVIGHLVLMPIYEYVI
jgi:hypothetical protein